MYFETYFAVFCKIYKQKSRENTTVWSSWRFCCNYAKITRLLQNGNRNPYGFEITAKIWFQQVGIGNVALIFCYIFRFSVRRLKIVYKQLIAGQLTILSSRVLLKSSLFHLLCRPPTYVRILNRAVPIAVNRLRWYDSILSVNFL